MLDPLLDAVLELHSLPGESEAQLLARLRQADNRLTALYRRDDVMALDAYTDPLIRAAYMLRYLPHYTLQLGDLLKALEGEAQVGALVSQPRLQHMAFGGGPAPEAIALAVLHQQGGGSHLHTKVLDQRAGQWSDCWPISSGLAMSYSQHPNVQISGLQGDLIASGHLAYRVVLLGRRAVEAERDAVHARCLQLSELLLGELRRGGRCDRHLDAKRARVGD